MTYEEYVRGYERGQVAVRSIFYVSIVVGAFAVFLNGVVMLPIGLLLFGGVAFVSMMFRYFHAPKCLRCRCRWRAWWNGSPTHLLPDRFEPTEFVGFWLASEYRFSRVLPSTRASFLGFSIRTPAPITLRVGLLNRSQQIEFVVTRDITEINQWSRIDVPFGVLLAVVNSDFEGSEIRIWSDDNDVYEFDELVTV